MANLTKDERRDLGRDRLEENGGTCDLCEEPIKRYTRKCVYDPDRNEIFCNKNGCADAWREAPRCSNCNGIVSEEHGDKFMNPKLKLCGPCWVNAEPGDILPPGVSKCPLPEWMAAKLDNEDVEAIEEGPNQVYKAEYIYQIGRAFTGAIDVMATRVDMREAFEACAEHNRRFGESRTESEILTVAR